MTPDGIDGAGPGSRPRLHDGHRGEDARDEDRPWRPGVAEEAANPGRQDRVDERERSVHDRDQPDREHHEHAELDETAPPEHARSLAGHGGART